MGVYSMLQNNMTANSVPTPYVASASGEYGTFYAYKAFDGLWGLSQYWVVAATSGWLQIDVGTAQALQSYGLRNNNVPEPLRMPNTWTMLGSNNASDWITLDTRTNETDWGDAELRVYSVNGKTPYRYFRLNITSNNGDALYTIVGEMYVNGFTGVNYLHSRRDRTILLPVSKHNWLT